MTTVAAARSLTSNVDFAQTEATWGYIPAAEVPAVPVVDDVSGTKGSTEDLARGEEFPFGVKVLGLRRPFLLPPEQTLEQAEKFSVLQDWEGVVERVGAEVFSATLRDRTQNESYATEAAELPIADVSDDDRELLRPGAIFYLTVGRVTRASGRQDRVGRLVFRRLPAWTESTLRRAEERAARLSRFLAPPS